MKKNNQQSKKFVFKKSLGQNFLTDQNILDKIIKTSNINKETLVIEVGVGAGALTVKLIENAKQVIGYEIDGRLEQLLNKKFEGNNNIELIFDDFLKVNLEKDIAKYPYKELYIIANLPYYITTPIILKIINAKVKVDKMIIMVQREMGDRIVAKPKTKQYNSLTVFLEYYFNKKKLFDVSRTAFFPKPKVDSMVLELSRKANYYDVLDEKLFFKLIKSAFKYKRKNLRNNLMEYNLENISKTLAGYNLDLTVRAEHLTINQFIDIANNLKLSS